MKTEFLREDQLDRAVALLRAGKNVIFPTETVYGLGGRIDDEEALQGIFRAKGRPADNPLIAHIYDERQLEQLTDFVPEEAKILMQAFWPGPLTLIFRKKEGLSDRLSAGLTTLAVRMPSHRLAQELLRRLDVPLAAPSANPSGYPSPTREEHLLEMDGKVSAILLGGNCEVGLESTVLDLSVNPPRILRPGAVTLEALQGYIPEVYHYQGKEKTASPGLRHRHYAPKTPVFLISKKELAERIDRERDVAWLLPDEIWKDHQGEEFIRFVPDENLNLAAQNLYEHLRRLDRLQYRAIYIVEVEEKGLGRALMDRIRRAAEPQEEENENCHGK